MSPLDMFKSKAPSAREALTLHQQEKEFLYQQHIDFLVSRRASASAVEQGTARVHWEEMDWDAVTVLFNMRFEGRLLPGCRGPRRIRPQWWLKAETGKIKEIRQLKGEGVVDGWWTEVKMTIKRYFGRKE